MKDVDQIRAGLKKIVRHHRNFGDPEKNQLIRRPI